MSFKIFLLYYYGIAGALSFRCLCVTLPHMSINACNTIITRQYTFQNHRGWLYPHHKSFKYIFNLSANNSIACQIKTPVSLNIAQARDILPISNKWKDWEQYEGNRNRQTYWRLGQGRYSQGDSQNHADSWESHLMKILTVCGWEEFCLAVRGLETRISNSSEDT